jgi:hypothetical protein
MGRVRRLLLLNLAFAFYDAAMMWLLQLDVYPSWRFVPTADFGPAESQHFLAIALAVFPIAVMTTAIAVYLLVKRPTFLPAQLAVTGAVVQAVQWALTAFLYGPWQGLLTEPGNSLVSPERTVGPANASIYHALLLGHWVRVALVTGYAGLAWWIASSTLTQHTTTRSRVPA